MLELIWQETEAGERKLELWCGETKICGFTDVMSERIIEEVVRLANLRIDEEKTSEAYRKLMQEACA